MINIVLYEPEIPQNTGNIMRTCVAVGAKLHFIYPLGFVLSDHTIKRSAVNYLDKLEYCTYDDWDDFLSKNEGDFYYFTRYGKRPHTEFDFSDKSRNIYLIFGKESTGIPKEILKDNLDSCVRIPASSDVRALNLSNCVAVGVYEVMRQQGYPNLSKTEVQKGEDYLIDE